MGKLHNAGGGTPSPAPDALITGNVGTTCQKAASTCLADATRRDGPEVALPW